MVTGQISSQALQEVHAQSSSEVTRSNMVPAGTEISASTPMGGETPGVPVAAMTSPALRTISRGSSGLPVAWAGQTLVHRPHMVHESRSSNCFQVNSSMVETPKLSNSVSMRSGSGFMAPLGRSLSRRYMFSGDVNMWRIMVTGSRTRKATNDVTWATHQAWCQPAEWLASGPKRSTTVASGWPTTDQVSALREEASMSAMRKASVPNPVIPMVRKTSSTAACSGLDLVRIR